MGLIDLRAFIVLFLSSWIAITKFNLTSVDGLSKRARIAGFNQFPTPRMNKIQPAGMQHQPWRFFGARQQQAAVQVAAQNRVAQMLAVNAELMGAPGFGSEFNPRQWQ